jgi:heterotetrameric sarcosine oxidase delta subunit
MFAIDCPWCGLRDEREFSYGAEGQITYPAEPSELTDAEWAEFVFVRSNPKGPLLERWVHTHGCRRWFERVRDTSTNEFLS